VIVSDNLSSDFRKTIAEQATLFVGGAEMVSRLVAEHGLVAMRHRLRPLSSLTAAKDHHARGNMIARGSSRK
jgi:hypothetical protein